MVLACCYGVKAGGAAAPVRAAHTEGACPLFLSSWMSCQGRNGSEEFQANDGVVREKHAGWRWTVRESCGTFTSLGFFSLRTKAM